MSLSAVTGLLPRSFQQVLPPGNELQADSVCKLFTYASLFKNGWPKKDFNYIMIGVQQFRRSQEIYMLGCHEDSLPF